MLMIMDECFFSSQSSRVPSDCLRCFFNVRPSVQLVAHHLFCFHHIIISYSPCFVYHFHHLLSYSYCRALWRGSVWIINSNFCILTYSHIWRLFVDSLVFGEPMFSSSCWFVVFCGQHLFICFPPSSTFHILQRSSTEWQIEEHNKFT